MSALAGRVHVTHPELVGPGVLIAAAPDVVAAYEARGWVISAEVPEAFDPDAPNRGVVAAPPPAVVEPDPLEQAARMIAAREAAAAEQVADPAPETPVAAGDEDSTADPADDNEEE